MFSKTTTTLALITTLVAGANAAGVCSDIRDNNACVAMGCKPTGGLTCLEPDDCDMNKAVLTSHGGKNYNTKMRVLRKPISPEVARLCNEEPMCTARYRVVLDREYTSGGPNCNDFGMLPPHGVDQTECIYKDNTSTSTENRNGNWYAQGLKNYVNYPFPNDGVKQSIATSKNLVTALTSDTEDCYTNVNCAFPYGYYADTIKAKHSICVEIQNAGGKWVEIMAAAKGGKSSSFCVVDADAESDNADKSCTKAGDLVDHRESGVDAGQSIHVRFHTEDNYDDANIDFHWRVSASYELSTNEADDKQEKDAEDWSQFRDGAQFPMALMPAYPIGYVEPAVFGEATTDAASTTSPVFALILAALCAIMYL